MTVTYRVTVINLLYCMLTDERTNPSGARLNQNFSDTLLSLFTIVGDHCDSHVNGWLYLKAMQRAVSAMWAWLVTIVTQ